MEYSLEYIRKYMDELDSITGFDSKDIKLSISKRMTRTYAYNLMKWDYSDDIENRKLINNKMVFSEKLLSCGASEEQIKEIIKHEYCHSWADNGSSKGYGHKDKEFIEHCNLLNCSNLSRSKDRELNNLYHSYMNNKNKNTFNYSKIFNTLTSKIKYISENTIRMNTLVGKESVQVSLTVTEKYPNCTDIGYLFDDTVRELEKVLKNNKDVQIIGDIKFINRDGFRRALINYIHLNILN